MFGRKICGVEDLGGRKDSASLFSSVRSISYRSWNLTRPSVKWFSSPEQLVGGRDGTGLIVSSFLPLQLFSSPLLSHIFLYFLWPSSLSSLFLFVPCLSAVSSLVPWILGSSLLTILELLFLSFASSAMLSLSSSFSSSSPSSADTDSLSESSPS